MDGSIKGTRQGAQSKEVGRLVKEKRHFVAMTPEAKQLEELNETLDLCLTPQEQAAIVALFDAATAKLREELDQAERAWSDNGAKWAEAEEQLAKLREELEFIKGQRDRAMAVANKAFNNKQQMKGTENETK